MSTRHSHDGWTLTFYSGNPDGGFTRLVSNIWQTISAHKKAVKLKHERITLVILIAEILIQIPEKRPMHSNKKGAARRK